MDTTVTALQNLYVAKGGELANVEELTTIPDMINALAELETASTSTSGSSSSNDNTGG